GRTYLAKDKPREALSEFEAVIAVEPKQLRALNGAGIALDLLGRPREAQQAYRAALAVKPDDPASRNHLGLSLALSGNYDEAVAELSQLNAGSGATARIRQNLALALGLKGDTAGMARIARADLDDKAIADNQKFLDTVRRLTGSGEPAAELRVGEPGK